MNTFTTIALSILFIGIPVYYFTILFSTYFKEIRKNKNNIKFSLDISSFSVYFAEIILVAATLIFGIYSFFNNSYIVLLMPMVIIDILVFFLIKLSSSKLYVFNDYIIVKNLYVGFNEIKNVLLKKEKKNNEYELEITTKDYLHTCIVKTEDPKSLIKEIKTLLPKNIKIKEVPAK